MAALLCQRAPLGKVIPIGDASCQIHIGCVSATVIARPHRIDVGHLLFADQVHPALWASRLLGRPVKFTATRSEAFLTDSQGRDLVTKVELALRNDGRFLAMRADNISNIGARCMSLSPLSKGSALITGSYDIPAASLRSRAVFTNTMMTQPYRSSGRPEVTYAIERLVDRAAQELGIDALAIRP
jgi:carbon-monoxide dehydrogenase large subunit